MSKESQGRDYEKQPLTDKEQLEMADECLSMIADALEAFGCMHGNDSREHTPGMMYPEWIACVIRAAVEARDLEWQKAFGWAPKIDDWKPRDCRHLFEEDIVDTERRRRDEDWKRALKILDKHYDGSLPDTFAFGRWALDYTNRSAALWEEAERKRCAKVARAMRHPHEAQFRGSKGRAKFYQEHVIHAWIQCGHKVAAAILAPPEEEPPDAT